MTQTRIALVALMATAAFAATAAADFYAGAGIAIGGTLYGGTGGYTAWGTFAQGNQGLHYLGGVTNFYETQSGSNNPIVVSSTVNDLHSVTISIDFTGLFAQDFNQADFSIQGLKTDGTIIGVQGNISNFSTDGSMVSWQGSAATLADVGIASFKIYQTPTPGALALLGMVGAARGRRRR